MELETNPKAVAAAAAFLDPGDDPEFEAKMDEAQRLAISSLEESLTLEPDSPREVAADVWTKLDFAKTVLRSVERKAKGQLEAWLKKNKELTVGHHRLYLGTGSSWKCTNNEQMMDDVLMETGGDVTEIIKLFLSSNCFRPAPCKKLSPELWMKPKETIKKGKAVKKEKKLQVADQRYVPKPKPKKGAEQ